MIVPEPGSSSDPIWEDGGNRGLTIPPGKHVSISEVWGDRESTIQEEDIAAEGEALPDGPGRCIS